MCEYRAAYLALIAADLAGAYDEDTVARIERATGRAFIPDGVGDTTGVMS